MIELDHVTKLYGTVVGVNDLDIRLGPGAWGLLGPNGAGKTTLLSLLAGHASPTMGRVRVFGADPRREPDVLRRIGFCLDVDLRLPDVSALDWVTACTGLYGVPRAEARARARDALDRLGLGDRANEPSSGFSKGMRQRVNLAQAVAHDPDLLVLDEPFNGLDPVVRRLLLDFLREWVAAGRSLVVSSHVLHEVQAIADRYLLVARGRLLATGSADEIGTVLSDLPAEVRVVCDRPRVFAARVATLPDVHEIALAGGEVRVRTAGVRALCERLPAWIREDGLVVHELEVPDHSLDELFGRLVRRHRGED